MLVLTIAQVKPDSPQHLVVPESVVVPHGDLEAPVSEVVEADALPRHRVFPLWVQGAAADRGLLLARLGLFGKEVTEMKKSVERKHLKDYM
jgi:hypothetical protein